MVCASLWLRVMLSKAAPFLGRKMLFGVGKGRPEFSTYFSSRLSGDVSAIWDHPLAPPPRPQHCPQLCTPGWQGWGVLISESWESLASERDPRGLIRPPANFSFNDLCDSGQFCWSHQEK